MEKLPLEVLSTIFLYLLPVDRLSCSLVCRRWAELMRSSQLLKDIRLDIAADEMQAASSVLVGSQRQYTNLRLHKVNLSEFDAVFWGKIGADLRDMELYYCSWSSRVFYAILQKCTKLESLKIARELGEGSIDEFLPPKGACQEQLRDSLSHLRHLHLEIMLTADVLDHLLGLMSYFTSIHLSLRLKNGKNDFLDRLPSILRENRSIRTGADFCEISFGRSDIIKFLDRTSGTLEELQINATLFGKEAFDAIVSCPRLRSLSLCKLDASFRLSDLEKLFSNPATDLQTLKLDSDRDVKFEDMGQLFKLKKLRKLGLISSHRNRITNESLCRFEEMSTLVDLNLEGFHIDSRVIWGLGCLKSLRILSLRSCPDSECFDAICENFGRLTELSLGKVRNLTDADGSKLCGFRELTNLSFSCGFKFSDPTFEKGVGSRAMKSLDIVGCSMTDAGLMSIASHHGHLKDLLLYDCKRITDAGIVALLQHEPRLQNLYLEGCGFLRYGDCATLERFCPRLRSWEIGDSDGASSDEDSAQKFTRDLI